MRKPSRSRPAFASRARPAGRTVSRPVPPDQRDDGYAGRIREPVGERAGSSGHQLLGEFQGDAEADEPRDRQQGVSVVGVARDRETRQAGVCEPVIEQVEAVQIRERLAGRERDGRQAGRADPEGKPAKPPPGDRARHRTARRRVHRAGGRAGCIRAGRGPERQRSRRGRGRWRTWLQLPARGPSTSCDPASARSRLSIEWRPASSRRRPRVTRRAPFATGSARMRAARRVLQDRACPPCGAIRYVRGAFVHENRPGPKLDNFIRYIRSSP